MDLWTIFAALFGGIVTLTVAWFALPEARAKARKLDAETDNIIAEGLYAEFERLKAKVAEVETSLAQVSVELRNVRAAARDEKTALEKENKCLRAKVERVTRRVRGLENILKVYPITPEIQALIDDLDTGAQNGKSDLRNEAEDSVEASEAVLREVKAQEAKKA